LNFTMPEAAARQAALDVQAAEASALSFRPEALSPESRTRVENTPEYQAWVQEIADMHRMVREPGVTQEQVAAKQVDINAKASQVIRRLLCGATS
jgi:hypothetical protein